MRRARRFGQAQALAVLHISVSACSVASPAAQAQSWRVTPYATLRGTYSDNIALAPKGRERSDFVAEVAPGLRITADHPWLKLNADYQHQEYYYFDSSSPGRSADALSADASWEAIERFFFVDAQASIAEQAASTFGAQSSSGANVSDNRKEVRSFRVSPYVRSTIGTRTNYEFRYVVTDTSSDAADVSRSRSDEWRTSINTALTSTIGFGLSYSHSNNRLQGKETRQAERDRTIERYFATLSYAPDERLRIFGSLGEEKSNFFADGEFKKTHGYGFSWSPSTRTSISAQRDRRFFGNGHSVQIAHRMPSSAVSVAWVKDVSSLADLVLQPVGGDIQTVLSDALTRQFPDPIQRNTAVRAVLGAFGLSGNELFLLPTLTDRLFSSKTLTATYAITGGNNTLTFVGARSDRRAISSGVSVLDDFAANQDIRTQTYGLNWGHRLSSSTTLTAALTQLRSQALGGTGENSRTTSATLGGTRRVSPRTSVSVDVRHVRFRGSVREDYRENAIVGGIVYEF